MGAGAGEYLGVGEDAGEYLGAGAGVYLIGSGGDVGLLIIYLELIKLSNVIYPNLFVDYVSR